MMMALACSGALPSVLVPGGVTLLPENGEDAGKVQTIGARFVQEQITLEYAAEMGCHACATPGGGCQILATAATAQVVGEALGLSLPARGSGAKRPAHLAGHRSTLGASAGAHELAWLGHARCAHRRSHTQFSDRLRGLRWINQPAAPCAATAHAAGLRRPVRADWKAAMRDSPRLVDALPNGSGNFAMVQVFLAGGVPEVMLHLRRLGLLETDAKTVSGETLGTTLDQWETSERRRILRARLRTLDGVDANQVILSPEQARARVGRDHLLPGRQPGTGGKRDQEHLDRRVADRCARWRRGSTARR